MEIHIIDTGYFYTDGGAMFGTIPKTSWNRRYPANDKNQCILTLRSLLIKTDCGRIILVDNGIGNLPFKQKDQYPFFDLRDLNQELMKRGVLPEELTNLVLTHLHFDHCGYTLIKDRHGAFQLNFSNANHWISEAQWNISQNPSPLEKSSYNIDETFKETVSRKLQLVKQETILCDTVSLQTQNGHTQGQIVVYIHLPENTFIYAGDVIPLASHTSPSWIFAYDIEPLLSYQEKIKILETAAQQNQTILFCHDAYIQYGTVKKINSFLKAYPYQDKNIL